MKIIQIIQKIFAGILALIGLISIIVFVISIPLAGFSFLEMISCGGNCTDTYNGRDLTYSGTDGFILSMIIFIGSGILFLVSERLINFIPKAK